MHITMYVYVHVHIVSYHFHGVCFQESITSNTKFYIVSCPSPTSHEGSCDY